MGDRFEEHDFEIEVLRIARYIWPYSEYSGSEIVDGRERDGIFETEECHHFVEATVSRSNKKAFDDCIKLKGLIEKKIKNNSGKGVRGWFVTLEEPTAEQRAVLNRPQLKDYKNFISLISFSQFQAKIIDVRNYFSLRDSHFFGSVREPGSDEFKPTVEYIDMDYVDSETQLIHSLGDFSNKLLDSEKIVILGDYGSGKSMTIREVYYKIQKMYRKGRISKFPIAINLREHMGNDDPSDILEKHAKIIGYPRPDHLVRAWKLGYAIILLDGFDEIAPYGINGAWKRLKEIRRRSLLPIKKFIEQKPDSGYIISGRLHYISDKNEMKSALGLNEKTSIFSLNEFTDEQVNRYLSKISTKITLPKWIPNKPLFVGHLAAGGIIEDISQNISDRFINDASYGWSYLLNMICDREAKINKIIDGETVKRIIERLATVARGYAEGLGPLTKETIEQVYEDICEYPFDENATALIQRFPGLGILNEAEESRKFIDSNFADVCRAGDIIRYFENPYEEEHYLERKYECSIGHNAIPIINNYFENQNITSKRISAEIEKFEAREQEVLKYDIFQCLLESETEIYSQFTIRNIQITELDLSGLSENYSKVSFQNCLIESLVLSSDDENGIYPRFYNCIVDNITGRLNKNDLPANMFDDRCEIINYTGNISTNSGIKEADLQPSIRVLIIILKKMFIQSLSGRKEKALYAGLELTDRRIVPDIINVLEKNELVTKYRKSDSSVWLPIKSGYRRAMDIMNNPSTSHDPILLECRNL